MSKISKEYLDNIEKELSSAVLCDIMDELGYRNQAMQGKIKPIDDNQKLVGIAKTILAYDVYDMPDKPYETEIDAIDSGKEGEVYIVCTNNSVSSGFWGELLATAGIARGTRGAIVDGAIRDIIQIKEMGDKFKIFAAARSPLDSKGRCLVADYDCPIMCDGVKVCPGDIVFADIDGIAVVPSDIIEKVIHLALEKTKSENLVRDELRAGARLKDVFAKYKIL